MPVQLEMIQQPNAEDLQDLVKIYKDYLDETDENIESWVEQQLDNKQRLFAGRFNSRLLGAIWATEKSTKNWHLEQLCVRSITRRRGVARQLMQLLAQQAQKQGITLTIDEHLLPEELTPLLKELGFKPENDTWQLQPEAN